MMEKNYQSSKLLKRKKRLLYFKTGALIFVFVLLVAGTSYVSYMEQTDISVIEVSETNFLDKEAARQIAVDEMAGNYFWLFSKNNIVLVPSDVIARKIIESNSAVKDVHLRIRGLQSIFLEIEEYGAVALWCDSQCYYLNENGLVFSQAASNYDRSLTQFHDWITEAPIGKTYVSADAFKKLMSFSGLISKIDLKVLSVNTEDGLTFNIKTDHGLTILYDVEDDPEEVASNLNAVIEKDAINRAQLGNIEYIDLRFGNKVYYKIR